MVIVDTDVLIDYLHNRPKAVADLNAIGFSNVVVTSLSAMELYKGVLDRHEMAKINRFLNRVTIAHVNEGMSQLAQQWGAQYALSHRPIGIVDLFNGAAAVLGILQIHTKNKRHFRHLPGVQFWK